MGLQRFIPLRVANGSLGIRCLLTSRVSFAEVAARFSGQLHVGCIFRAMTARRQVPAHATARRREGSRSERTAERGAGERETFSAEKRQSAI